jgi:hypothetical protein
MRIPGSSRSPEVAHRAGIPPMSPSWLRTFRPAWRALVGWPAQTPVGYGPTESSGRQPEPRVGVQGMSTAAGPGGGAALVGALVAPPPIFPPPEPAATTNGPAPTTRERVVLLPHARTEPPELAMKVARTNIPPQRR